MFEEMVAALRQPDYCSAASEHSWLLVWPADGAPRWACPACQIRDRTAE